jgi:catechol 2,3-dioxygenase-like lactoylglutathione lyase family enzyme
MTDWFARPVLHVSDVEASLRFYIDRLGFTSPWRYEEDGKVHIVQVDRQGCALILADTWPAKIGKGLIFISWSRRRTRPRPPRSTRCARNSKPRARR